MVRRIFLVIIFSIKAIWPLSTDLAKIRIDNQILTHSNILDDQVVIKS